MRIFNNLGIQAKLVTAFLVVLTISTAATGFVLYKADGTNDQFTGNVAAANKAALHAAELRTAFQLQHQETKNILLRGADPEKLAKYSAQFDEAAKEVAAKREIMAADLEAVAAHDVEEAFPAEPVEPGAEPVGFASANDLIARFDAGYKVYMETFPGAVEAAKNNGNFDPSLGDAAMSGKDRDAQAALEAMAEHLSQLADVESAKTVSAASTTAKVGMIAMLVAVALGLFVGVFIARQIKRPLVTMVEKLRSLQTEDVTALYNGMTAMAQGDLTKVVTPVTEQIPNPSGDEVGVAAATVNTVISQMSETMKGYNSSRESLAALIGEVQEKAASITSSANSLRGSSDAMAGATGQIASAIDEVTRSAVNLAGLSQESAREIERVAAGSQQLAATASSSADSASQSKLDAAEIGARIQNVATASTEVAEAAEQSRIAAQDGQQAVGQAVTSMEAIATAVQRASRTVDQLGEYGEQIGNIVKAIDEIAAQTNLLALNAAIEAARAGEQGRGFAVVAENVRSLAERSSDSTKEIADLIAKVQLGTQEAVEAMAAGVADVDAGRNITTQAGAALDQIIASVQQSAVQMKDIASEVQSLAVGADRIVASAEQIAVMAKESAGGADEMARGTTRVTEAIVQVSATSEETSASAEEVSASTEELSAQSQELAATANQMSDLADALSQATARFRLA
ncbi:MAG: methyl-accepting chemotaxis protein [Dehalococcoidia bacterium]